MTVNYYQAYRNGCYYYKLRDYIYAKYWLSISLSDSNLFLKSIKKIIVINIKQNNYQEARDYIERYKNMYDLNELRALLECIEYNYDESLAHYKEFLNKTNRFFDKTLLNMAIVYMNKRDHELSCLLSNGIEESSTSYIDSQFSLIYNYIYQHDYETAFSLLNKIKLSSLMNREQFINYKSLEVYLLYYLNRYVSDKNSFFYQRLTSKDNELLIQAIDNQIQNGVMLDSIDKEELIETAKTSINELNANNLHRMDVYCFKTDKPVGYVNRTITNDIKVITILDTKKIVSISPIILSDEYNKEGYINRKKMK